MWACIFLYNIFSYYIPLPFEFFIRTTFNGSSRAAEAAEAKIELMVWIRKWINVRRKADFEWMDEGTVSDTMRANERKRQRTRGCCESEKTEQDFSCFQLENFDCRMSPLPRHSSFTPFLIPFSPSFFLPLPLSLWLCLCCSSAEKSFCLCWILLRVLCYCSPRNGNNLSVCVCTRSWQFSSICDSISLCAMCVCIFHDCIQNLFVIVVLQ